MTTSKTESKVQALDSAKTKNEEPKPVSFFKLFRYAQRKDYIFMAVGLLASIANGVSMPLFAIVFGSVANNFNPENDPDEIVDLAGRYSLYFLAIGVGAFILSYLSFASWMITGERQAIEFRKAYFKSLIRQEIAYFDTINPAELSSKIANECFSIQQGIGEKVSTFFFAMSMMASGFIIGFIKGWQLALVLCAGIPVMGVAGSIFVIAIQKSTTYSHEAYNKAGGIAEESLNGIRTVVALGGQEKEVARYKQVLEEVKKRVIKFGFFSGGALGFIFFALFATYALGFWYGSKLIEDRTINTITDEPYNTGDVLSIFFSVIMGAMSLSQVSPCIKCFSIAKGAAAKAFQLIDRQSAIDIESPNGLKPDSVEGNFVFNNVKFSYPLKKERIILDGISFTIRKNEKTAFVGESGCGKTTSMQLVERFYDINEGSIKLDGNELKEINLKWLRSQIGYVGQEPVLFATSIRENLLLARESATDEELWDALKNANAAEFVGQLPAKLDTYVGTSGTQLSGGQKQRLAIARAILKNPKILLLDEATSALDRKNELEIQQTLDKISEGRTTIVIAHRLTTIQNADHIIVFDQGKIVEEGNHTELVAKKGRYFELQGLQIQQAAEDNAPSEENTQHEEPLPEEIPLKKNKSSVHKKQSSYVASAKEDLEDPIKKLSPEEQKKIKKEEAKKKKQYEKQIMQRLFLYNKKERPYFFMGLIFALINGAVFPMFALLISDMLEVFTFPDAPDFRSRANRDALYFLICGIVALIANFFQMGIFGYVGENLTLRIRSDVFQKLLKMTIGWFDLPENAPGALATKLSTDATLVNSLTSTTIGVSLQSVGSFATGMIIAFTASWQLTLVMLGFFPVMVFSGALQAKFNQGFSAQNDNAYRESAVFVAEAVNNMRTVASFGREDNLVRSYEGRLEQPLKVAIKRGNYSGLAFGFSQMTMFLLYSIVFYIGAIFTRDIGLGFQDMFQTIFGVMFAAMGAGTSAQFAPDVGAAKNAAINLFKILDSKPEIDIDDPSQDVRTPIKGDIEFKNVHFKYPTRPKQIFKGINFKINASQKVALVGPSGCGKSTVLSLLLRFYDIEQGEILIDGVPIKKYDLKHLRKSFGVVSQEPTLFNGTIEYNIKYTKDTASDEEMRQAAIEANALKFIENNEFDGQDDKDPQASSKYGTGFQRKVGPKGSQISGGQKQRVAIARALLNKPNALLLDEATSALDSQNEKIVQESLDTIMKGKTSIVVAHRISTIKDSDEILVFMNGEIVENGNYQTLNKMQGTFYKLERGLPL